MITIPHLPFPGKRVWFLCLASVPWLSMPLVACADGIRPIAGACDHYTWGGGVSSKSVDGLAGAGLDSVRSDLFWKAVEKQRGAYAWNDLAPTRDAFLSASARGMQPLGILNYGNDLYPSVTTQEGRDAFARYATWIATELKGKVRYYEVWNEWNGEFGPGNCHWGQPPCNDGALYTKLLCSTHAALKKVDPLITVLGGAVSAIDTDFITRMMNAGAASCMDGLSVHPYQLYNIGGGPEATVDNLQTLQNTIRPIAGREVPIYITEEGMTTPSGVPHEDQASHLSRFFLGAKTLPFIKGIWVYMLRDITGINDFQNNFGLMRVDYTSPKPAYYAVRNVVGLFTKADYLGKVKSPSDIWMLKFRESDGSYTYALWSTGGVSTKTLVFDAAGSGTLSMEEVGSNPPIRTKASFFVGQTLSVSASKTPVLIRSAGPSVNVIEIR